NWEKYSRSASQSFVRYPTFEEWLNKFLEPVVVESYRVLRKKAYFAINVTNGNRLPTPHHVSELAEKVGLKLLELHMMEFPKVPYLHPRNGRPVKHEFLMVYQK